LMQRFGSRGLAICVSSCHHRAAARLLMPQPFRRGMTFSPGLRQSLADATIYVLLVVTGVAVMRGVVGQLFGPLWR